MKKTFQIGGVALLLDHASGGDGAVIAVKESELRLTQCGDGVLMLSCDGSNAEAAPVEHKYSNTSIGTGEYQVAGEAHAFLGNAECAQT